ncbi:hypothetical protein K7432_018284 [Basidiobolus ranarum]|uniref:Uncharacterized protein n=1 Tax=Basidiobolus ranarum TaxID=34480 RepID=A0ABR2VKI5_9FUNG
MKDANISERTKNQLTEQIIKLLDEKIYKKGLVLIITPKGGKMQPVDNLDDLEQYTKDKNVYVTGSISDITKGLFLVD